MKNEKINVGDRVVMSYIGGLFHDWMDYREGVVVSKCEKKEEGSTNLGVEWDDGCFTRDNEFTVDKLKGRKE